MGKSGSFFLSELGTLMSRLSLERLTTEWTSLLESTPPKTQQLVQSLAAQHKVELAAYFYSNMLSDPDASVFLSHEEVKSRLSVSMQNWLTTVFSTGSEEAIQAAIAQQLRVGEIHARVAIPVHLVLRGARHLKECFHQIVHDQSENDSDELRAAVAFISNTIDFAMEIMSHAYSTSHERQSRAEEGYRLFAVTQN